MDSATENQKTIIKTAKLCARLIMENGGETSRAEDTVYRICNKFGFDKTEIFATPTGIFITVSNDGVEVNTSVTRVKKRGVNLIIIEKVNDISRRLSDGRMSIEEALNELEPMSIQKSDRKLLLIAAAGLASGFFALMFNGTGWDFLAATLCGIIVESIVMTLRGLDSFNFAISILGGFIIGAISVSFVEITGHGSLDKIISGAIMPLLPGVPMVNAIRDTMRGDLLSGVSRGAEALLIATSLAFGAGVVLKLYLKFAF